MKTSILKARSISEVVVSPSGEVLCASDAHDFFYVVDLKTFHLIHEEELERDLESMRYDKSGKILFLNDGILTAARLAKEDFRELPLMDTGVFEDSSGLKFIDSKVSGEMIFFLPVNGNLYKLGSIDGNFEFLAHVPYDSISGNFFGKTQDKLILSALGSSKVTIINLENQNSVENIPSVNTWQYSGDLEGVSLDEEHFSLLLGETISIFDATFAEVHTYKMPVMGDIWLTHKLSPDFSAIALSGNGGVYLFDIQSGKGISFCRTDLHPNELAFVPGSDNKIMIASFADGDISLLNFT